MEVDAALIDVMTRMSHRVLAGERAYDVAHDADGEILGGPIIYEARHGGIAYVLWAAIADVLDGPDGPQSEQACNAAARAAAADWLAIDPASDSAVMSFFERWNPSPGAGSAWRSLVADWQRPRPNEPRPAEPREEDATVRSIQRAVERYAAGSRDIDER
jgi:hypothetical protein